MKKDITGTQRGNIEPALDKIASQLVDAAFKVHFNIGPGLLEQVYEFCLVKELSKKGLRSARQVPVPVLYEGESTGLDFRLDLLVQDAVVVELKAVERILPVHHAQLITYLKLSKKRLGFLINFNVPVFKKGIKRIAV